MNKIKIKRIYEELDKNDGTRILIDRLWPRGIKKINAHIDMWIKDIAPSNELRKKFSHDRKKWDEFKNNYIKELQNNKHLLNQIILELNKNDITLLYGAKDTEYNNAVVLKEHLTKLHN